MLNPAKIKSDFPIFKTHPSLVYLDSTATSLKPKVVIDKLREYYKNYTANIHRGLYWSSEKATEEYWQARELTAKFIDAERPEEVIFTRNATESINIIASTLGYDVLASNEEVVVTISEHHSNFVPWQQLALQKGAKFRTIDVTEEGYLNLFQKNDRKIDSELLSRYISKSTKILALTLVSNTLGTINPVKDIIKAAKELNPHIITVVDAAQAVPHLQIDVQTMGCDFLAFSAHKMLGPTGVGVLWGRYELLEEMPPYQYGGEMIHEVAIDKTTFKLPPDKFEAGTPHIAGVIAFKEAIKYVQQIGLSNIREHEKKLTMYAMERLNQEFGERVQIIGPKNVEDRCGIVTFTFDKYHPHDIAQIVDEDKICIRAGHHCTMPLHTFLNVPATARASFYIYNDEEDVEKLIKALRKVEIVLK
jgi:cysteine desulfurase / selenocysteine lyase